MESAGMAFAIVFTIIVIGFLLVFGYGQIMKWLEFQAQAQVVQALKGIEETARRNYEKSEGSMDVYAVRLPESAGICFIDPQNPAKRLYPRSRTAQNWDPENVAIVRTMIKNNGYNIFYYVSNQNAYEGYKIDILRPAPDGQSSGNFCARNGMKIMFVNKGLQVEVGPA